MLLPAAFGRGFPDIPYDDVYVPFLFYPGGMVWSFCGRFIAEPLTGRLFELYSPHQASMIGLLLIPGLFALIAGGIMWFIFGRILDRRHDDKSKIAEPCARLV